MVGHRGSGRACRSKRTRAWPSISQLSTTWMRSPGRMNPAALEVCQARTGAASERAKPTRGRLREQNQRVAVSEFLRYIGDQNQRAATRVHRAAAQSKPREGAPLVGCMVTVRWY
jgi:hypothetical protein